MAAVSVRLLDEPDRVRLALSPMKRRLLERLRTPASATALAAELTLGRQRVNYHLRALEAAGLIELVEERQRRGCVERILAARAEAFVVDPAVIGPRDEADTRTEAQDRFAAGHLIETAASVVRDVARMQTRAAREATRLLVFTLDTEVTFETPGDLERFVARLADFVAREAARTGTPGAGRRYRIVAGGHPAPKIAAARRPSPTAAAPTTSGERHVTARSRDRRVPRRRSH